MEYVRICDVYGAGYFYIPGTENCMKIGGYYRYEMQYNYFGDDSFSKLARFAPNFTVSSETAWGTLTGYAELEFDWYNNGFQSTNLYSGYIQLGGFLIGKHDTPYSRFLGYGGPTLWEGYYGYNNTSEISYTFTGGNGFSAIIALTEDEDFDWAPNVEAGFNFEQSWGSIGAIAGYDEIGESFGVKGVARFKVPSTPIEASLHVFYGGTGGTPGVYHIYDPLDGVTATEWSVLLGASAAFTDTIGVAGTVQWFDTDAWEVSVNLPWTPVEGLTITPEVVYTTSDLVDDDAWNGRIRFQRSF